MDLFVVACCQTNATSRKAAIKISMAVLSPSVNSCAFFSVFPEVAGSECCLLSIQNYILLRQEM